MPLKSHPTIIIFSLLFLAVISIPSIAATAEGAESNIALSSFGYDQSQRLRGGGGGETVDTTNRYIHGINNHLTLRRVKSRNTRKLRPKSEKKSKRSKEGKSSAPSEAPSDVPSSVPTDIPSVSPSNSPSFSPSDSPSSIPTNTPSDSPSDVPSSSPSTSPSSSPTQELVRFECGRRYRTPEQRIVLEDGDADCSSFPSIITLLGENQELDCLGNTITYDPSSSTQQVEPDNVGILARASGGTIRNCNIVIVGDDFNFAIKIDDNESLLTNNNGGSFNNQQPYTIDNVNVTAPDILQSLVNVQPTRGVRTNPVSVQITNSNFSGKESTGIFVSATFADIDILVDIINVVSSGNEFGIFLIVPGIRYSISAYIENTVTNFNSRSGLALAADDVLDATLSNVRSNDNGEFGVTQGGTGVVNLTFDDAEFCFNDEGDGIFLNRAGSTDFSGLVCDNITPDSSVCQTPCDR